MKRARTPPSGNATPDATISRIADTGATWARIIWENTQGFALLIARGSAINGAPMNDAPVIQTDLPFEEIGSLKMLWVDDAHPNGVLARLLPSKATGFGITVQAFATTSSYGGVSGVQRLGYLTQEQFDRVAREFAQ